MSPVETKGKAVATGSAGALPREGSTLKRRDRGGGMRRHINNLTGRISAFLPITPFYHPFPPQGPQGPQGGNDGSKLHK